MLANGTAANTWVIDFSLGLVKRTGAFHLGRDLVDALKPDVNEIRQWRIHSRSLAAGAPRKVFGKLMSMELGSASARQAFPSWPRRPGSRYLYLDPLYTLQDDLAPTDMVLCHDVGPITHPHAYSSIVAEVYKPVYDKIARVRPSVAFVSHASKAAFIDVYGDDFPALPVIPLYIRDGIKKDREVKPVPGVTRPFFLTVGEVGTRKGQCKAIEGFATSGLAAEGYQYVICGPSGYGCEQVEAAAATTENVVFLSYVPDAELNWLYDNAEAFVLPSLIEGFGIPSLEAARRGLLPIISKDPALQEVSGGLAITIADLTPGAFTVAFREFLALSDEEKASRIAAIVAQGDNYSFQNFVGNWRQALSL